MIFMLFCSGPRSSGAAVGGGERSHWCRGTSAEAAAAEHRPAAAHRPAGQTDPRTGAENSQPADIQWVPSFGGEKSVHSSLSLSFPPPLISVENLLFSLHPWSFSSFSVFTSFMSLRLPHSLSPGTQLIIRWQPSLRTHCCSSRPLAIYGCCCCCCIWTCLLHLLCAVVIMMCSLSFLHLRKPVGGCAYYVVLYPN